MSFELRLLEAARNATGDNAIDDVAEFHPKGTAAATGAGAALGSLAGGSTGSDWGQAIGSTVGAAGGAAARALASDLPAQVCIAVSPTEVYVLGMPTVGVAHLEPIAKIHRDQLGVEIHQRISVRTVVLEDLETGYRFELEAQRLNFYHAKSMIELLKVSDEHHDEDRDPSDAESTEPVS